jgi:hypothetical protein
MLFAVGSYFLVYEGLIEPNLPGHRFTHNDLIQLASGGGAVFFGLLKISFGELIQVLFSIEKNTRNAYH